MGKLITIVIFVLSFNCFIFGFIIGRKVEANNMTKEIKTYQHKLDVAEINVRACQHELDTMRQNITDELVVQYGIAHVERGVIVYDKLSFDGKQ